jgi:hypothetical protein
MKLASVQFSVKKEEGLGYWIFGERRRLAGSGTHLVGHHHPMGEARTDCGCALFKISFISSICRSFSEFKRRPTAASRHNFDARDKFDPWFIRTKTDGNCGFYDESGFTQRVICRVMIIL